MNLYAHYELELLLNRGGMGEVWLARDTRGGEDAPRVALKIPNLEADAPAEEILRRFAREARTLARLDHPGIPRHIESQPAGDLPFLAMEYVDGVSLRELETRARSAGESAALDRIADITRQLTAILAYLHGTAGLIHRDVKPDNILVTDDGRVVLVDFGIAIAPDQTRLTTFGRRPGTVSFMAPEQHDAAQRLDSAVDVYAFGLVVYELLTGRLPEGRRYRSVRKVRPDADRAWDRLLKRCLDARPERRPRDGQALVAETAWLDSVTADSSPANIHTEAVGGAASSSEDSPRNRRHLPASLKPVLAGGILGLLLIAGALIWLGDRQVPTANRTELAKASAAVTSAEAVQTQPSISTPIPTATEEPDFADVIRQLRQGDLTGARKGLETLVSINPADNGYRLNLALLCLQQGERERAREVLREGLRRNPDSGELRRALALAQR